MSLKYLRVVCERRLAYFVIRRLADGFPARSSEVIWFLVLEYAKLPIKGTRLLALVKVCTEFHNRLR